MTQSLPELLATRRIAMREGIPEIARRAGVIWQVVANWESGNGPSPHSVAKMLAGYELAWDDVASCFAGDTSGLGRMIRLRRIQLGMTMTDLADAIETRVHSVSNWERGASTPSARSVSALEGALGIELAQHAVRRARPARRRGNPTVDDWASWAADFSFEAERGQRSRVRLEPLYVRLGKLWGLTETRTRSRIYGLQNRGLIRPGDGREGRLFCARGHERIAGKDCSTCMKACKRARRWGISIDEALRFDGAALQRNGTESVIA